MVLQVLIENGRKGGEMMQQKTESANHSVPICALNLWNVKPLSLNKEIMCKMTTNSNITKYLPQNC